MRGVQIDVDDAGNEELTAFQGVTSFPTVVVVQVRCCARPLFCKATDTPWNAVSASFIL